MDLHERVAAAATLRQCREALAAGGSTVIGEAAGGGAHAVRGLVDWRHYPEGEAYDPATHAQYFYHQHAEPPRPRAGERPERGHFHLFLRGEGMPPGVSPLVLPELAVADAAQAGGVPRHSAPLKRGRREEICHLVAVAVDPSGEPIRLFTTNRWVTGESWYQADDVIRMLSRFRLAGDAPSPLLNRWLTALVALYRAEIAWLLNQRDKAIMQRRWRWRGNVFEDPRLEIISSLDINLDAQLAAITTAVEPPIVAAPRRPARLPPMAEGWGA